MTSAKLFQRLKELHGDLGIGRDERTVLRMLLVELGSFVKSIDRKKRKRAKAQKVQR